MNPLIPRRRPSCRRPSLPRRVLAVAATLLALPVALAAAPAPAPARAAHVAAIQGAGATGLQVQNLDFAATATAVIRFYARTGAPVEITRIIPPGTAANVYLPTVPGLANGAYSMVVSADRPIAALARTDWDATRAAGIYSSVVPGREVILPLVVAGYRGQTSLVSIQNTDVTAAQTVHVEVRGLGAVAASAQADLTIAPGASATIDFERDADFGLLQQAAPDGFVGWMRVAGTAEVAVQSFIDVTVSPKAVYAFEGVPTSRLATELVAPLVRKRQATVIGTFDTGIAVVNPGATAATVRVRYDGSAGSCTGQTFDEAPVVIGPSDAATIYQGASAALPAGCVASARLSSTQPVAAVVLDAMDYTVQGAAYAAVPLSDAARTTVLPLVRRQHTPLRLTTGIQLTNPGDAPARVDLAFADHLGAPSATCGAACGVVVPARGSRTLFPSGAFAALAAGGYGSGVVTSDQPLVVLVNDISEADATDAATYLGLGADPAAPAAPAPPFARGGGAFGAGLPAPRGRAFLTFGR